MLITEPATLPELKTPCLFCRQADGTVLAGDIVASVPEGYLIQAAKRQDGGMVLDDGHWLIIPWACVALANELPDNWLGAEWDLMSRIPGFGLDDRAWPPHVFYYLSGCEVGQTQRHHHRHVRVGTPEGIHLDFVAK